MWFLCFKPVGIGNSLSYQIVIQHLDKHFDPQANENAASYAFFMRNQAESEKVRDYITDLRRLAKDCSFEKRLERMLEAQVESAEVRTRAWIRDRAHSVENVWLEQRFGSVQTQESDVSPVRQEGSPAKDVLQRSR
ncbi:hypothetical protein V5799_025543 [Amblyomma americanum]|uniref:Retrotransposon gag domain-containing protein n=1 Tax=Amblyomma americanum TaxID=6943 RepID=A0AAQ4E950_AMBAM